MVRRLQTIINEQPVMEVKRNFETDKIVNKLISQYTDTQELINEMKKLGFGYNKIMASLIAHERHSNPTIKYDERTDVYYAWKRGEECRKKINRCIRQYLFGLISDKEYEDIINSVNDEIDLNKYSNQKTFVQEKMLELLDEDPTRSRSECKKLAKVQLSELLVEQERRKRHYCSWYENPGL